MYVIIEFTIGASSYSPSLASSYIKIILSIVATPMGCIAMPQYGSVPIVVKNSTLRFLDGNETKKL